MLTHLHIRDLAIVASLELELAAGLTVLTGETGAGKSILIDALGLALGERADNTMIRAGCDRAEITASFRISELPAVAAWLEEHTLSGDGECILRRVLIQSEGSRAFINGSPVPVKSLQELGDLLVDIHGQHAHQSLLHRNHQLGLLDSFAALTEQRHSTETLFHRWRESAQRLRQLQSEAVDRADRLGLLRYQVEELEALRLEADEPKLLGEEHKRLSNAGRLLEGCSTLLNALYEDEDSLQARAAHAGSELEELTRTDPALSETHELVENAAIQLQEAAHSLRNYLDRVELDPERLQQLEQRLAEIHELSRKHRCREEDLPALLETLRTDLEALEHADVHLADLERETGTLWDEYLAQARELDRQRREAADRLGSEVSEGMQTLGMPGGVFEIRLETLPEEKAAATGLNRVEFLVSANPGQPTRPLTKVASGGELSRISLAIQVATIRCSGVPILIFDEVDVGIGGGVAEIVGRLLRQLGDYRQVLCVTHLPQVAAQGSGHLQIAKHGQNGELRIEISTLTGPERVQEIARMLGGVVITDQTLAHAEEMVGNAQR